MRFYWERVEASRNFANKVWNASRFIMMNLEKADIPKNIDFQTLTGADKWILSKVNTLAKEVTENLDKYELGIAVQKMCIRDRYYKNKYCGIKVEKVFMAGKTFQFQFYYDIILL